MYSANSGRCHVNIHTIVIPLTQGRLNAWAHGAVARGPTRIGAHANLCMLHTASFLMIQH
jgi:hypothetical protein